MPFWGYGLLQSKVVKQKLPSGDKVLFGLTVLLSILGTLSIANTSAPLAAAVFHDAFFFVKQQLVWLVIGFVAMIVVYLLPYQIWKRYARVIFGASVVSLILVLIPSVGSNLLGARRWIAIGPVGFQPSEAIKITLALFFAYLADKKAPIKHFVWTLIVISGLVMLQPDLGTTISIVVIGFSQMFIAGLEILTLGIVLGGGGIAALILVLTSEYRRARLVSFFSHESDPSGVSYHVRQILLALGSGGLFGVGLGQSTQKQLFLPETATDSVFAIIAEELGFIGASVLVVVLAFFTLRSLRIAKNAPDTFSKVLATGIAMWIGGQMFLNIASMVSLTPLTGIPLPFFSYGGSSLVMIFAGIGILLQISRHTENNVETSTYTTNRRARRNNGSRGN